MLNIGEFARMGSVSVRTLHHYEELGLLKPATVDPSSGYRRYSAHQLPRLHRIIALKDLGLSFGQIHPILDDMSPDTLRGMLLIKRVELEGRMTDDQKRLARVEQRLHYIEQEGIMSTEILLKDEPQHRIAIIAIEKPGLRFENLDHDWFEDLADAFFTLAERLQAAGVPDDRRAFIFYRSNEDGDLVPYVAVDIGDRELTAPDIINIELPATEVVSTVIDYGGSLSHASVGPI